MRIALDYGVDRENPKHTNWLSDREMTVDYITFATNQAFPEGLDGQKRRVFGRIDRKLQNALKEQLDEIELEEAEKDFLKEVFLRKDPKFRADLARFVIILEDEIAKF